MSPAALLAEFRHSFLSAVGPSLLHQLRQPLPSFFADTAAPLSGRGGSSLTTGFAASSLAGSRGSHAYQGRDRFDKVVSFFFQVCNNFIDFQFKCSFSSLLGSETHKLGQ